MKKTAHLQTGRRVGKKKCAKRRVLERNGSVASEGDVFVEKKNYFLLFILPRAYSFWTIKKKKKNVNADAVLDRCFTLKSPSYTIPISRRPLLLHVYRTANGCNFPDRFPILRSFGIARGIRPRRVRTQTSLKF